MCTERTSHVIRDVHRIDKHFLVLKDFLVCGVDALLLIYDICPCQNVETFDFLEFLEDLLPIAVALCTNKVNKKEWK